MQQKPLTPGPRSRTKGGQPHFPGHPRIPFGCRRGLFLQEEGAAPSVQSEGEIRSSDETVKRPSLTSTPASHWGRRHPRIWSAPEKLLWRRGRTAWTVLSSPPRTGFREFRSPTRGGKGEKAPLGWLGMRPLRSLRPAAILAAQGRARSLGEVAGQAGPPALGGAPALRAVGARGKSRRADRLPLRSAPGSPRDRRDSGPGAGGASPALVKDCRDRGGSGLARLQFAPGGRQQETEPGARLASSLPAPSPAQPGPARPAVLREAPSGPCLLPSCKHHLQ